MATLHERLTADMKEALRARESLRLSTIRLLLASLKNAQIEAIREQYEQAIREQYEQYRKGGREDLESEEEAERAVIESLSAGRRDQEKQLSDEEALAVLRKQARMRHEAIEQYRKGGREDLASKEEAELAIIESYLPAAATEDQIRAVVREVIAATGASGPKDMGVVMRTTMSRLGGRADGRQVQGLVREELAALGG
jgi:uncharacterized protein